MSREIIKAEETDWEDYWVCGRCNITSDTEQRMCPCPRGGCDAELVGEKETKTTIYKLEPKHCDCGKGAKWNYVPSSNMDNPYCCEDCVPRGCDHCNNTMIFDEHTPFEITNGKEGFDWMWVEKGRKWKSLDKGKDYPCSEWWYDENDDNFKTI
jgi:hypothetical protein